VAIWTIRMQPGATWTLPPARDAETMRTLYFFQGPSLRVADEVLRPSTAAIIQSDVAVRLEAGDAECEVLLLQGRPIGEPVVTYGPFVMNTAAEIQQAMLDYRRTKFGGWPWPSDDPVHARADGRFAKHPDGGIVKR